MGRFVIPKRLRREMDLNTGTGLEISVNGNSVILEKVETVVFLPTKREP